MSRIVIDTNQLEPFLAKSDVQRRYPLVTLSPYVLAETVLRPIDVAQQALQQLAFHDVLIGLQTPQIMKTVATLDESGIVNFAPFGQRFVLPATVSLDDARAIKVRNRAFADIMFTDAKEFRKRMNDQGKKLRLGCFKEAIELSVLESFVFSFISNGSSRTLAIPDIGSLFRAVMQNQYLSRFFKGLLYYVISYSRGWADQSHNFDPTNTLDDWTDLTLLLYAADGDTILTADGKLRNALRLIDLSRSVNLKTAQEP